MLKLLQKKFILILLLIVLILGTIVVLFSQNNLPGKAGPSPNPLPSTSALEKLLVSPSPFVEQKKYFDQQIDETKRLYPLIDWLPIDNERYHLTYANPGVLEITIKSGTQEEIKKEVVDWIRSKGVDPSTQQIVFK
jgi:hypothetical protein